MGNYEELKQAVALVIRPNGNQEIDGQLLQNTLFSIINVVGANATFAGIATPETNPGTPDQNIFYILDKNGSYVNFNNIVISNNNIGIATIVNGQWVFNELNIPQSNYVEDISNKVLPNGSTAVITTGNLLNETTFTDGKYLNKTDGSEVSYPSFSYTDYISVQSIKKLICYNVQLNGGCFYDINKSFIIGFGYNQTIGSYKNKVVYVPENAAFVRFNVAINDRNNGTAYLIDYENKDVIAQYPWLIATDHRFSYDVNCGKKNTILNSNGNETQFNNYNTYYFNVSDYAGKKILINAYGLADPNGYWSLITCIKNDGTKDVIINTIGNYVQSYVYNVPENAKEIGISSNNGNITVLTYDNKTIKPIDYKTIYDVENSISDLQQKVLPNGSTAVITTGNLLNETTFTDGKYLNKTDGSEVSYPSSSYTDYISVQSIKKLRCYSIPTNAGCFYDSDKTFIIGFGIDNSSGSIKNAVIDVPENAAFIRFNVAINDRNNGTAYLLDYDNKDVIAQYPWLISTIDYEAIQIGVGIGWLSDDGTIKSIPTNGKYYKFDLLIGSISVIVSNSTGISKNAGWSAFWFVDENGDYIESVSIDTTEPVYENYEKIIPANAKQIWVSSGTPKVVISNDGNVISDIYNKIENASNLNHFFGKKIVWLGTSIPYGQTSEAGVSNPMPTPYPIIVGNNLKANVVNVARPGMAIETEPDGGRKTFGSLSLSIAELEEQGYPTTPYQSYENAMLGQDADLYVFDCEPNNSNGDVSIIEEFDFYNWKYKDDSTFESHRDNYIGAFLFLLDKLWAEKPDAKVVMVSEFGYCTEEKWGETYPIREASLAIAKKLNIHVINLWDKLFYNKQNLSIYMNTDNVHPKVAAHIRMGAMLTNELLLID